MNQIKTSTTTATTTTTTTTTVNPAKQSESRLYVGNLSPAVDEFALVALFSKFGKISKLDFLFHKSGILRGKPRGYAFIEMNRRDEALKAMIELNNKPVRGKRILVTPANESQYQEHQAANQSKPNQHHSHQHHSNHPSRLGQRGGRLAPSDPMRPTTLSILKSQQLPKGVNNKIAALEAKLASMQHNQSSSTICPSSIVNQKLPQSSSTADLTSMTKPSFLPENPMIFCKADVSGSTNHQNQRLGGRASSYHPIKSTSASNSTNNENAARSSLVGSSSKNSVSTSTATKRTASLEAIGLTLKEQLKRNRESKSTADHVKLARMSSTGKLQSNQVEPNIADSKGDQQNKSHLINYSSHQKAESGLSSAAVAQS